MGTSLNLKQKQVKKDVILCRAVCILLLCYAAIGLSISILNSFENRIEQAFCVIAYVLLPAYGAYGVWKRIPLSVLLLLLFYILQSVRPVSSDSLLPHMAPISFSIPLGDFSNGQGYLIDFFAISMILVLSQVLKVTLKHKSSTIKRRYHRAAVIVPLTLIFFAALYFLYFYVLPKITVNNNSNEAIHVIVTLPSSRLDFGYINTGQSNAIYYALGQQDGQYEIELKSKGQRIHLKTCGYVTSGEINKRVTIVIDSKLNVLCPV